MNSYAGWSPMAAKCNIRPNTSRANRVWAAGAAHISSSFARNAPIGAIVETKESRVDQRRFFTDRPVNLHAHSNTAMTPIYRDNNNSDYWASRPGVLILVSASHRKLLQRTLLTVAATAGRDDACWTWAR
jgi:hypothetical protein